MYYNTWKIIKSVLGPGECEKQDVHQEEEGVKKT